MKRNLKLLILVVLFLSVGVGVAFAENIVIKGSTTVLPIVNPKNRVKDLTIDQLSQIYQGKITNWIGCGRLHHQAVPHPGTDRPHPGRAAAVGTAPGRPDDLGKFIFRYS